MMMNNQYCMRPHLSHILFLLLFQSEFDEDLLQLLIAVVDDELLKAVVLKTENQLRLVIYGYQS